MSRGFEIAPKQETQTPQTTEQLINFGREFVRAFDEGYLGEFVVEKLATLDRSAVKALKKMTGRDISAG